MMFWLGPTYQPVTAQPDWACVTAKAGRDGRALHADEGTTREIRIKTDHPLVPAAATADAAG